MSADDELEALGLRPLPRDVVELCAAVGARPRLIAHLTLVHDVACEIVARLEVAFPGLAIDSAEVLLGAATHDIGKAVVPEELTGPGHAHEEAGRVLLRAHGYSERAAR